MDNDDFDDMLKEIPAPEWISTLREMGWRIPRETAAKPEREPLRFKQTPGESTTAKESQRILRLPEVLKRTGLSRSTIYDRIKKSTFPKSINLGPRSVGWTENEVDQWLENRIQAKKD